MTLFVTLIVKACLATAVPGAAQCVDVPVPPEVMTAEMSPRSCRGRAGYIASAQFLGQSVAYHGFEVGGWTCQISDHPASASTG